MKRFFFGSLLIVAAIQLFANDALPVIYLPFDGDLKDRGPNEFKVKSYGDEIRFVPGVIKQAVFIGGTEDWIDVIIDSRIDLSKGATLEFWFKREDWENPYKGGSGWQSVAHLDGMVINITAPGCPSHVPWTLEASVERFQVDENKKNKTERVQVASADGFIKPNRWYHAALIYNAEKKTSSLYINGNLVSQKPDAPVPTEKFVNPLRIGTWYKANQAFRGSIDELKLYDFARPPPPMLVDPESLPKQ